MCIKPEEVKDPSRSKFFRPDATKEIQDDKKSFDATKMYSFFNPLKSLYMKVLISNCMKNPRDSRLVIF